MTPQDALVDFAHRFKALGHPVRLQILDLLRRSPECVCHLEAVLGRPQPYISQQLRVLRDVGLIVDVKEGANVFYHLTDPVAAGLLEIALGAAPAGEGALHQAVAGCSCPKCQANGPVEIRLMA